MLACEKRREILKTGKNRVLGCGEKIESEDGQRIGFERGAKFFFFLYWVLCIIGF